MSGVAWSASTIDGWLAFPFAMQGLEQLSGFGSPSRSTLRDAPSCHLSAHRWFHNGRERKAEGGCFRFPKIDMGSGTCLANHTLWNKHIPFWRQFWVDDFPLPKVEYFSSLEGIRTSLIGFLNLLWIGIGFFSCCVFDAKAYDFEANLSEFWSEAEDPASKNTTKRSEKLNGYRNPPFRAVATNKKNLKKRATCMRSKPSTDFEVTGCQGACTFTAERLRLEAYYLTTPLEGGGDSGVIGQSVALWWLLASLEGKMPPYVGDAPRLRKPPYSIVSTTTRREWQQVGVGVPEHGMYRYLLLS